MNTILTDYELPPLQPQDHPEPHSFAWTEQEMRAIRARDRLVEAAVLAKLREQEPVAWHTEDHLDDRSATTYSKEAAQRWHDKGWPVTPLYAAPLPAVVQVPQEFDYKHPRAQALIGADARHRIQIDLIWQILEDPCREFTASDMEYWDKLHDKVQEVALAAAPEAPAHPSVPAPWREAVKVAREREAFELWVFDTQHRHPTTWDAECAKMGGTVPARKAGHYYLREDQIRWEAWCAAIARIDALGGGE